MSSDFEKLDEEITEGARSPMSGLDSAIAAGGSLRAMRVIKHVQRELPAYLFIQSCWFMAFGLQMVLFPFLITERLALDGMELGLANMALSAPSVVFLLIGGVLAERADGKQMLVLLHLCAAVPAVMLGFAVGQGWLSYPLMIIYGITMGTIGAFMMPARDAILNEVVDRRSRTGSGVTLQQGATFATLAQFGAQILGLVLAGFADKATKMPFFMGGFTIGPIPAERLLLYQGLVVALGAAGALMLAKGRQVRTGRKGLSAAFGDMADGFRAVTADARLWAMTALMFGVGIFVIGSFLVVLPIVNRDVFGLGSDGIRDMFVTFWFGAFVSSAALSGIKGIKRPGRLLLTAQFLGSMVILAMIWEGIPHEAFLVIVFCWGLAAGISIAMSRTIVQGAAPKDQLARVLSIYQLGFMAGAPLGAAMMGFLVDAFGPHKIAFVPALGMGALIIWVILRTPIWNMKKDEFG